MGATWDDIVSSATRNLTIKETAKILGLSVRTIQRTCEAHGVKWSDLRPPEAPPKKLDTKTGTIIHPTAPLANLHSDPPPVGANAGTSLKLTEEVLEDALVRVLMTQPEKGLGPALAFLDKKKGLSVESEDTISGYVALDKLKEKRRDMFV